MKKLFFYISILLTTISVQAQINEIGVFAGGVNYIGDVGKTNYINPNKLAGGIIYKWNRSTRHAYRFSYTTGSLYANDTDTDVPSRNLRGFEIKNKIHEFSAGIEFNFFPFDLHTLEHSFSPYVYSGLSYFIYNETYIKNKKSEIDYRDSSFAIPMVVGLKTKLNHNFVLSLEVGARYTFTDNLDTSNPKNKNLTPLQFGNLNSNDWYVFSGIALTYTFGENPCFCAD